jgi:hypothetical protein
MQITFNSLDEVKEFVKALKGTRGPKGSNDEGDAQAPAPIMPPVGGAGTQFAPSPSQGFGHSNPFPAHAGVADSHSQQLSSSALVNGLVQRIVAKIDGSLANGQPTEPALNWFRSQCGSEAASATMDQIKTIFLPRMAVPALENIAKLVGA